MPLLPRLSGAWLRPLALPVLACLALCACGPAEAPRPTPEVIAAVRPADARLAEIYATACHACHTTPDSGAPLTAVPAQWRDRLAKGMPAVLTNVVQGLNGMPAGGQCFACTPADYEALIRFMSSPPSASP
ncbi:c-type cytochrome [Oleisolibacter albus]|uniref:c-type cytochrome n=1 Tax=Oleisolibacter albus TaxID=2171757 RepID=UPI000DF39D65|nr:c-type cytochrome [Oleisolibacter albus]